MREILELQTGQVAFLSGLLAGFAMTAALNILRLGMHTKVSHVVFYISVLSSLLFLVALYIDVRLTLELAGKLNISDDVFDRIKLIRFVGTTSATIALSLFVVTLGMLGWLSSRADGIVTGIMAVIIGGLLLYIWLQLSVVNGALN